MIVDGEPQFKYMIPTRDEMNFVYRTHEECKYYRYHIDECRSEVARDYAKDPEKARKDGYRRCHNLLQRDYDCSTRGLLEPKIEDSEEGRLYFKAFSKCFYKDLKSIGECRKYLDDHARRLFRMEDSPLDKYKVRLEKKE